MPALNTIPKTDPQTVLVFGPPKSGKTQLVGQLAEKYDLLWFDLERGYSTLFKLPASYQERINLIALPDTPTFPIAVETMRKIIKGKPVDVCNEHGKVSCMICKKDNAPITTICLDSLPSSTIVVIDSLTQFTSSAMAHINKGNPDDYKFGFDDWGVLKQIVEPFLSAIQGARYNIVCISHEEEVEMEGGRKKIVPVAGSSKTSRNTAKNFGHVVYCELKNKKHIAASATDYLNNVVTGSRSDMRLEDGNTLLDIFTHAQPIDKSEVKSVSKTTTKAIASTPSNPIVAAPVPPVQSNTVRTSDVLTKLKAKLTK
jgi:hypothetical protein